MAEQHFIGEERLKDLIRNIGNLANTKQNKLTFDEAPTDGSTNPVTSKGIKKYVDDTVTSGTVDLTNYATKTYVTAAISDKANRSEILTKTSQLTNDAGFLTAHQDISGKQDVLTFDENPTDNSNNPVKSKGIKLYVDNKVAVISTNQATNYYTKAQVNTELDKKLNKDDFVELSKTELQSIWDSIIV